MAGYLCTGTLEFYKWYRENTGKVLYTFLIKYSRCHKRNLTNKSKLPKTHTEYFKYLPILGL